MSRMPFPGLPFVDLAVATLAKSFGGWPGESRGAVVRFQVRVNSGRQKATSG
ncbi:MAG: hypothetical protein Q8M16_10935 [Pirellulaceae bacterium]|nr:hypothetical protein [Pirellulaceae bacterium]